MSAVSIHPHDSTSFPIAASVTTDAGTRTLGLTDEDARDLTAAFIVAGYAGPRLLVSEAGEGGRVGRFWGIPTLAGFTVLDWIVDAVAGSGRAAYCGEYVSQAAAEDALRVTFGSAS